MCCVSLHLEIVSAGKKCAVAIGLVPGDYPRGNQPGWQPGSIGYHADDGGLVCLIHRIVTVAFLRRVLIFLLTYLLTAMQVTGLLILQYCCHCTTHCTRMWADAQHDGRPAEYRLHPLWKFHNSIFVLCHKVWLRPAAGVLCSNAANIRECKTCTQSEFYM